MSGSSSSENINKCCFGFQLFGSKPDPLVSTDASTIATEEPNLDGANGSNSNDNKNKKKSFLGKFQKKSSENGTKADDDEIRQQPKTVVVTFNKPKVDSYIGLSLKKYKRNNSHILVHSISPTGLLKGSPLKQGQKLVSINNIECPQDLKSAIDLLKTAPAGPMRIEVQEEVRA